MGRSAQSAASRIFVPGRPLQGGMTGSSLPEGWTEGDVETNGARLHYYRSGGDGRPFVVAHGITSDGRSRVALVPQAVV